MMKDERKRKALVLHCAVIVVLLQFVEHQQECALAAFDQEDLEGCRNHLIAQGKALKAFTMFVSPSDD